MRMIATVLGVLLGSIIPGLADAGTIKGTVRLVGGPVEVKKLKVTVDHSVCGTVKDSEELLVSPEMGIRKAVVFLQNPPPNVKWTAMPGSNGPEAVRFRAARGRGAGRHHGGVSEQRPAPPQSTQCRYGKPDRQPNSAQGADHSAHVP